MVSVAYIFALQQQKNKHLKNVKSMFGSQAVQKQATGWVGCSSLMQGSGKDLLNSYLTPSRDILGRWLVAVRITFYIFIIQIFVSSEKICFTNQKDKASYILAVYMEQRILSARGLQHINSLGYIFIVFHPLSRWLALAS